MESFLFTSQTGDESGSGEDGSCDASHGSRITQVLGKGGLNGRDSAGDQSAALVREAGQKAAKIVGGEFAEMGRNDAPSPLYTELHEKSAGDEQAYLWRISPQRSQQDCAG